MMNDRFDGWTADFKATDYDTSGAVVAYRQGTLEAVRLYAEPYD
jgi:hypothetical protein